MSDRLFFGLAALAAIGLIALALVWPPRAETGLHEPARTAPAAEAAAGE